LWQLLADAAPYKDSCPYTCIESNQDADDFLQYLVNIPSAMKIKLDATSAELNVDVLPVPLQVDVPPVPVQADVPDDAVPPFSFRLVTASQVELLIAGLKKSNTAGLDKISGAILNIAAPVLAGPLSHIINHMFETNTFPVSLKKARITILHKGGDTLEKSNYRPISILPAISKILERAIKEQFTQFSEDHQLFNTFQSGYRKFHSTRTALLHMSSSWAEAVDGGCCCLSLCSVV
jgi:hypothetical protein